MTKKDFFKEQSDGTQVKIAVYCDYIEGYLMKILMYFGVCFIGDLFCGPGKIGKKNGSPLILIEKSKQVLKNIKLINKQSNPKIYILFNDLNQKNIEKLKLELSKISIPKNIIIYEPISKTFSEALKDIKEILKKKIPKFFFLDPFSYGSIKSEEIENIIKLPYSEVLLFLPTFFAYRFTGTGYNMPGKLKSFLKDFTDKGIYNYQNIYEFNKSIKNKFQKELKLEFVRPILIDVGSNKNTLLFISSHILGMLLINKIFFKKSHDGKCLRVSEIKQNEHFPMLFKKEEIETKEFVEYIISFQKKLVSKLKKMKVMTNIEIVRFTIKEGFLPKHANQILTKLKKDDKIKVKYFKKENTSGLYIAENKWRSSDNFCSISLKVL